MEGGEAYICCADAELEWRCEQCAKVSEGFAFPYGMCPYCGGALEALHRDGISDEAGLQAIRAAYEIELGGLEFYYKASQHCTDPALQDLFGKLAAMEGEHMETLSHRYHLPVSVTGTTIFASIWPLSGLASRASIDDPATLFSAAIAFEQRAAAYLQ